MSGNSDPTLSGPAPIEVPQFNPYAAELSTADAEAVRAGADVHLYFTPHTTGPLENVATAAVVGQLTPENGFLVVESFGQPASVNSPRYRDGSPDTPAAAKARAQADMQATTALDTVQRHGQQSPFNNIQLAQRMAQGRRIPFVAADLTAEDIMAWQHTQEQNGATALPSRRAAREAYFTGPSRQLGFSAAAAGYRDLLMQVNGNISTRQGEPRILYRWGELNNQRDRAMANTLGHTTVEQLGFQPQPEGERLQVVGLFGPDHQAGTEATLTETGIPFTSHVLGSDGVFREAALLPREDHDAYRFAADYLWYYTQQGQTLGANYTTTFVSLREIPLSVLEGIYEAHCTFVQQIDDTIQQTDIQNWQHEHRQLAVDLAQELRVAHEDALHHRQHHS